MAIRTLMAAAGLALLGAGSQAAVVTLDFEGAFDFEGPLDDDNFTNINDFYAGGTSGDGNSGTDYGISFSENGVAVCLNTLERTCSNVSRGGQGNPASAFTGFVFNEAAFQNFINVAGGFTTGFSFYYNAPVANVTINIYDGLDGTGNLLATSIFDMTPYGEGNCEGYDGIYCPFVAAGLGFAGTAHSVSFGAFDSGLYDDFTFGSVIPDPGPSPVPVPASLPLLAAALGAIGLVRRRGKA